MKLILNLLPLKECQREEFLQVAKGYEQIFAPNGVMEDNSPIPKGLYRRAVIILGNLPVEHLADCKNLRLLHTRSAGTDRYQKSGPLPDGLTLMGASGAYGPSVSEHMFAMLLAMMKRLPGYRDQQWRETWNKLDPAKTLYGAQVLCVGTGDIGSSFAQLCKALGAKTTGVRQDAEKPAQGIDKMYSLDRLDELLAQADVVALMLPHAADTVHLMDRRRLLLMKRDAILLNGGRGTAIDHAALAEVLEADHLWGACLDVTDPEPLPVGHPLWTQERVMITPHTAYRLEDTMDRIVAVILKNLALFLEEGRL